MSDLISRQAAIDALIEWYGCEPTDIGAFENIIEKLPSAQPDMSEYSDKLWKAAYERGKAEGREKRKKGHWIPVDSYSAFGGDEATWMAHGNPIAFYYCSKCKEQAYAGEDGETLLTDFCPNCGADMRGERGEQAD